MMRQKGEKEKGVKFKIQTDQIINGFLLVA